MRRYIKFPEKEGERVEGVGEKRETEREREINNLKNYKLGVTEKH